MESVARAGRERVDGKGSRRGESAHLVPPLEGVVQLGRTHHVGCLPQLVKGVRACLPQLDPRCPAKG